MYTALLHTHNLVRWVILLLGVLALVRAFKGIDGKTPYALARRTGVLFLGALHLQVLLGLALFLTSPFISAALTDMKASMADRAVRFFVAEHPMIMVAAAVLMTIGSIVAKNADNDAGRHRKLLVFLLVTLGLIGYGIPWGRPLL